MVRFDAYVATARGVEPHQLESLLFFPGDTLKQGKGHHSFAEQFWVEDDSGTRVSSVQWGGRQGDRIMVEVKGERTPRTVEAFRQLAPDHRCTRVDSCADWDDQGAFERLLGPVLRAKKEHRLYGEQRGDWEDHPELGRTYKLGAASSPVQARLYEKGKQPEYRHLGRDGWTRLEVQVRPQKDAKTEYATISASDVWGANKWTRQLAAELLLQHVDPHPPGTVRKLTDRDRALRFMVKQYGPTLAAEAFDLGGWDVLGFTLMELHKQLQQGGTA